LYYHVFPNCANY